MEPSDCAWRNNTLFCRVPRVSFVCFFFFSFSLLDISWFLSRNHNLHSRAQGGFVSPGRGYFPWSIQKLSPKWKATEDPGIPKREERLEGEGGLEWSEYPPRVRELRRPGTAVVWGHTLCPTWGRRTKKAACFLGTRGTLPSGTVKSRGEPGREVILVRHPGLEVWVNCLPSPQPPAVQDSGL